MTKIKLRQQALKLRKKGMSYSHIKNALHISKSTISRWLSAHPLSKERINELRGRSEVRIEKFRATMKRKRYEKLNSIYAEELEKIGLLSQRELFLAGLFLYWGEGNKSNVHTVSINNSDPTIVQFAVLWLRDSLRVPINKIKLHIHLYKDMEIQKELHFWSAILDLPIQNFTTPYIKDTLRQDIDHKGFGHGTCGVVVHNALLKQRILMGLEVIKDTLVRKI